ncbi:MAG: PilW family protein [Methylotenera sp.]|nr:PilW family protein [Methylotenera sp.]
MKKQLKQLTHKKISMRELHLLQKGFSLVELLVGLIIGLLVTLVVMQTFSAFEGSKRTTSGSSDAQTNGNVALYSISRDVQQAGFGMPVIASENSPFSCVTMRSTANAVMPVSGFSPVVIVDGGGGASDTLTVRYGDSPTAGMPMIVRDQLIPPLKLKVDNNMGCRVGDLALYVNSGNCALKTVKPYDVPPTGHVVMHDASHLGSVGSLYCLGNLTENTYSINAGALQLNAAPMIGDIVNMQAQYGVSDAANTNVITQWVNATGIWAAAALTPTNRNRIRAIRLAVVARNNLLEKDNVTPLSCTTAKGTASSGPCAWDDTNVSAAPQIDLSTLADWRRYRYRVYETIIPVRNMIWASEGLT